MESPRQLRNSAASGEVRRVGIHSSFSAQQGHLRRSIRFYRSIETGHYGRAHGARPQGGFRTRSDPVCAETAVAKLGRSPNGSWLPVDHRTGARAAIMDGDTGRPVTYINLDPY
jgi:hypothetical protein